MAGGIHLLRHGAIVHLLTTTIDYHFGVDDDDDDAITVTVPHPVRSCAPFRVAQSPSGYTGMDLVCCVSDPFRIAFATGFDRFLVQLTE